MTYNPTERNLESAFWDERFKEEVYAYGLEPNDFLREQVDLFQKGDQVLCLAEGEGRNGVFLAQHHCRVRGVDFSAKGRKKALRLAQKQGVNMDYDLADLTTYEMGRSRWNGIVSLFCHLPENQRPALYQSIKDALKPGGLFLVEAYNKRQLAYSTGGPANASHLFSLEELVRTFSEFETIVARDLERDIQEGPSHNGLSAVTQFIVRKRK